MMSPLILNFRSTLVQKIQLLMSNVACQCDHVDWIEGLVGLLS